MPRWLRALASESTLVPRSAGPSQPSRRELFTVFLALLAVATAVYLPHVFTGGFYTDDWYFLASFRIVDDGLGSVDRMLDIYGSWPDAYRPLQTLMLVAEYLVFGTDPSAHIALSIPLAAIQSFFLYLVLRMLGLSILVAASAALLLDIGYFIDTTRIWETLQVEMNASTLYLAGLACALRGLRSPPGRPQVLWHVTAVVLYLAAAFTYEGMVILIPLSFLAYLVVADRRSTLQRFAADLPAFGVAALLVGNWANDLRSGDLAVAHLWGRLREVVPGAIRVFEASFPAHNLLFEPAGLAMALLAGAGVGIAIARGGTLARASRQWCLIAAASTLLGLICLAPLLPGPSGLTPGNEGFANRLLITSAPFYAVLLVAVPFLVSIGVLCLVRRPRYAAPVALVLISAIAVKSVVADRQRQDELAAVWTEEKRIVESVTNTVPDPDPGSRFVTFGHPIAMPGGFVSFGDLFDLDGALKLAYEDESIQAHPYLRGAICAPDGLRFSNLTFSAPVTLPYERLYFIDTRRNHSIPVGSRPECRRAVRLLHHPA